jgi:hypothetical protein
MTMIFCSMILLLGLMASGKRRTLDIAGGLGLSPYGGCRNNVPPAGCCFVAIPYAALLFPGTFL